MIKVTLRIDELGDIKDRLGGFLEKYDKYLVYEEVSAVVNKLHYQGVVCVNDEKAYTAIKTRFSTYFKDVPKGGKSMAKVKSDNYEIYISKDKNPIFIKAYSNEEVKELQEKSYQKEEVKVKRRNPLFIEIVDERFEEWLIAERKRPGNRSDWTPDRRDIIEWLMETFTCMKKLWDVGVLTKYANYLEYQVSSRTVKAGVLAAMIGKY